MKKFTKTALLITSGISILFPVLYFLPRIYNTFTTVATTLEIALAISISIISTMVVHTNQFCTPWKEYIEDRYKVKKLESDPWKLRKMEHRDAITACVFHFIISFVYCIVAITDFKTDSAALPVSILCYVYYTFIAIVILVRVFDLSDAKKENWQAETRWQRIKKACYKYCTEVIEKGATEYYTSENLREQLPFDIEQHIIEDFSENLPEFDFISLAKQEFLTDYALNIAMKKGFKPKIMSGNPEPLDQVKTFTIGALKF